MSNWNNKRIVSHVLAGALVMALGACSSGTSTVGTGGGQLNVGGQGQNGNNGINGTNGKDAVTAYAFSAKVQGESATANEPDQTNYQWVYNQIDQYGNLNQIPQLVAIGITPTGTCTSDATDTLVTCNMMLPAGLGQVQINDSAGNLVASRIVNVSAASTAPAAFQRPDQYITNILVELVKAGFPGAKLTASVLNAVYTGVENYSDIETDWAASDNQLANNAQSDIEKMFNSSASLSALFSTGASCVAAVAPAATFSTELALNSTIADNTDIPAGDADVTLSNSVHECQVGFNPGAVDTHAQEILGVNASLNYHIYGHDNYQVNGSANLQANTSCKPFGGSATFVTPGVVACMNSAGNAANGMVGVNANIADVCWYAARFANDVDASTDGDYQLEKNMIVLGQSLASIADPSAVVQWQANDGITFDPQGGVINIHGTSNDDINNDIGITTATRWVIMSSSENPGPSSIEWVYNRCNDNTATSFGNVAGHSAISLTFGSPQTIAAAAAANEVRSHLQMVVAKVDPTNLANYSAMVNHALEYMENNPSIADAFQPNGLAVVNDAVNLQPIDVARMLAQSGIMCDPRFAFGAATTAGSTVTANTASSPDVVFGQSNNTYFNAVVNGMPPFEKVTATYTPAGGGAATTSTVYSDWYGAAVYKFDAAVAGDSISFSPANAGPSYLPQTCKVAAQ